MMKGKMTSGSPWRLILVFSLPILLSGLLQQCYNIADTMIVGRFLKLEALTGMGATWALNYIIIAFCQGAGMGIGIPVSQQYGAGRDKELRRFFYNGMYVAMVLAVIMTGFSVGFCRFMLVLTKTAPSVLNYAYDYIVVIFAGIPFTILFNACFGILMAFGNSKLPSVITKRREIAYRFLADYHL
jgi:Na+-driven multidrug efflux pump